MCKHLVWRTILQGNSLRNAILGPKALHNGGRIYKVLKSTYPNELKGNERNVFEKGVKVRRSRRLVEKKRT